MPCSTELTKKNNKDMSVPYPVQAHGFLINLWIGINTNNNVDLGSNGMSHKVLT